MEKQLQCPECGSFNILTVGKGFTFLLGLVIFSFSLWLLLIPFIGVAMAVIGLLFMLTSFLVKKSYVCQECKYRWEPTAEAEIKA